MVIRTTYLKFFFIVQYTQARSVAEMVILWFDFERTSRFQLYHYRIVVLIFFSLLVLRSDHFLLLLQTDNVQIGSIVMTMVQNILQINRWFGFTKYNFLFLISIITNFIPVLLKSIAYRLNMTLPLSFRKKMNIKYLKNGNLLLNWYHRKA